MKNNSSLEICKPKCCEKAMFHEIICYECREENEAYQTMFNEEKMEDRLLWWGYTHINGSIQAKRYWDDRDRKDAKYSPFVITVYGPFPAQNRDEAIGFIEKLSKKNNGPKKAVINLD